MARLDLNIDDKLDAQFRDMVYKKMGTKRGDLRIAIEEAIKIWLNNKKGHQHKMLKQEKPHRRFAE